MYFIGKKMAPHLKNCNLNKRGITWKYFFLIKGVTQVTWFTSQFIFKKSFFHSNWKIITRNKYVNWIFCYLHLSPNFMPWPEGLGLDQQNFTKFYCKKKHIVDTEIFTFLLHLESQNCHIRQKSLLSNVSATKNSA